MSDNDLKRLHRLVGEAANASRGMVRDIERAMGVGNGNLKLLAEGKMDLKVRHVLGLARFLGVPPKDFFELGCPDAERVAEHRLEHWVGPHKPPYVPKPPEAAPPPDLAAAVRDVVREELGDDLAERIRAVVREALTETAGNAPARARSKPGPSS